MRAVGIVFVGLIACGSLTLNSSSGYGTEGLLTSLSSSQASALPNNDVETKQGIPTVSKLVPADLLSPGPKARLYTLDHWSGTHTSIPLSTVFEAIEDQDEKVRARAAAIIEQQWATEQYVMDLTFSMTRGACSELPTKTP